MRRRLMLHNTLTLKKEPLRVVPNNALRMFVCGPTVQSFIHIGHARSYVFYDLLAKYLGHLGVRVNFLMNITDVDDRITEAAKSEETSPKEIVEKYAKAFFEDMRSLGIDSITDFERVSDYVPVMLDQISLLLDKGFAYLADGVIYFDTSKFHDYGRLSHQSRGELLLRPLELSPNKKNLLDFSLWRPVILEEGKWDSPWGKGSPGWHIEDTAVTLTNFGPQYDIHGGAYELIYPHHEAEIAQAESLTGKKPLVRYWVHTGLVNLGGRKMSKSAGNTYLVRELLKEFSADELRYYLLCSHYREDMEFSLSKLRRSGRAYAGLVKKAEKLKTRQKSTANAQREIAEILSPFYTAMDDDLDTPKALEWFEDELLWGDSADGTAVPALRTVSQILGVRFGKT